MVAREAENIETALSEGLELFGLGRIEAAIERWRWVLTLVPDEPRALDYLSTAGVDPSIPVVVDEFGDAEITAPIEILDVGFYRRRVAALVSNKKYEEALELLTEARRLDPGDVSLSRSMSLLKQHLSARYRANIGTLELVARRRQAGCPSECDPRVWRLVDGISTVADILELSPAGEFRSLRAISHLLNGIAIELVAIGTEPLGIESLKLNGAPLEDVVNEATLTNNHQPGPRQAREVAAATEPADSYDALFREASTSYLRRDHGRAIDLFERCLAMRPDDTRVQHNLATLRKRNSK